MTKTDLSWRDGGAELSADGLYRMTTDQIRARLNLQPARSHASHWRIGLLALSLASLLSGLAFGAEGRPLAKCRDGKTVTSTTGDHRGACSGHGGVARYLDGSPAPKGRTKSTSYS